MGRMTSGLIDLNHAPGCEIQVEITRLVPPGQREPATSPWQTTISPTGTAAKKEGQSFSGLLRFYGLGLQLAL